MDFLICYEHIVREIENDTLLMHALQKRGYSCKIIHFNDIDYALHAGKEKAKVVVTPWLRQDDNVYHFLRFAKKPYKLVNLQWEQVYSQFGLKIGLVETVGQSLKAYHLCWGENSKNRLQQAGVAPERLPITGAMQMDYGSPLFDSYYAGRAELATEFGLDNGRKWNLLVSSFAYANYGEEGLQILEKKFRNSFAPLVEIHKNAQRITLDWVEELLKQTDCEFIYRPHPSENVDLRLKDMAEKYPHFHLISAYSVKQWGKVCDKVNLWISTSNAELAAMRVDYGILRPCEIPYEYEVESMRNEEFITDLDGFLRYNISYQDATDLEDANSERLKRIEHYYSYDPKHPAYQRVADFLEAILKSTEGQHFTFSAKQKIRFRTKEFKQRIVLSLAKKCSLAGSHKPIAHLPLKPALKKRIQAVLDKNKAKQAVEERMQAYLNTHDSEEIFS